jgi:hypothetical protein
VNETMSQMKPAKIKDDIWAILFKGQGETRKTGNYGKLLMSFQTVLQESLHKDMKDGLQVALQGPMQKKAKMDGEEILPGLKKGSARSKSVPMNFKADVAAAIEPAAKELIAEKKGRNEKEAPEVLAPVPMVFTDAVKVMPKKMSVEEKAAVVPMDMTTETLFKRRVADVLIGGGLDREGAERIADQIRRVAFVREAPLPAKYTALPLSGKTMPAYKAEPFFVNPTSEGEGAQKGTAVAALPEAEKAIPLKPVVFVREAPLVASGKTIAGDKAAASLVGPPKEGKGAQKGTAVFAMPEDEKAVPLKPVVFVREAPLVASGKTMWADKAAASLVGPSKEGEGAQKGTAVFAMPEDEKAIPRREVSDLPYAKANNAGGDLQSREVLPGRQKARNMEQAKPQDLMPHAVFPEGMKSDGEARVSVQPVRAQEIITQIADLRNAQPDQTGRVRIVLDPPNLGTVEMDIVVRGDRVSAVMTTDNQQVQQVLRSHMEEMRLALNDQGFRLDRIEIRESPEKNAPQWQNSGRGWDRQQRDGNQPRKESNPQGAFSLEENLALFNTIA